MSAGTVASFYMHMGAGHWFLMALGLLVLVAVLFWVATTLARDKRGGEAPSEEVSALHLLDRRLAQGEITAEERDDARRVLAGERKHGPA